MRKFFIFFCLLFSSILLGQQVEIQARFTATDIKIFMLSDLNFTSSGTPTMQIFEVIMMNKLADPVQCQLSVAIRAQELGELASGTSAPFTLSGMETMHITNLNIFNQMDRFSLQDYVVDNAGDELASRILATGKLPSDIYYFEFELMPLDPSGLPSRTLISLDISNPSILDLIAPGGNSTEENVPRIFTNLPLFRWESDLQTFKLIVAEKLDNVHQNANPEQIIQDQVRFEKILKVSTVPRADVEIIPSTSYQYPATGAWPLEFGKTYYWRIIGLAQSAGGQIELPSEIWMFQVQELVNSDITLEQQQILNQLKLLLGDQFDKFLDSDGELAGYLPTGLVTVDGRMVSQDEISALLKKLQTGEILVKNITVE